MNTQKPLPQTPPTVLAQTFTSKDQTDHTQPLSLEKKPEVLAGQLQRSARTAKMPTPTKRMKQRSKNTLRERSSGPDMEFHAAIISIAVEALEKAGLCSRKRVLATDGTVKEIRVVFDPKLWTEDLRLKQ